MAKKWKTEMGRIHKLVKEVIDTRARGRRRIGKHTKVEEIYLKVSKGKQTKT